MRAFADTDAGRVRDINEDAVLATPELGLVMLADGMGGHAGGEVASSLAVKAVSAVIQESLGGCEEAEPEEILSLLARAIEKANASIVARVLETTELKGMGSTLVMALERDRILYLANVGDSRAYLLDKNGLRQLTRDHSVVADMVRAGDISPREARKHRLRNYLTRCLGQESTKAELRTESWSPGDFLLLCSDGLTNMLEERDIEKTITRFRANPERICRKLIETANAKGGHDNISVVVACPE